MDLLETLDWLDQRISQAESDAETADRKSLEAAMAAVLIREELEKLRSQRVTVEELARTVGVLSEPETLETIDVVPTELARAETEEWRAMSRLDAVERVLREATSARHITEIETDLKFHGRTTDTYPLVSASLANLRARRGTVVPVGHGRWEYNRAGTTTGALNAVKARLVVDATNAVTLAGLTEPRGGAAGE
jgi:hypothetical protein